jgi:hypothetical protein
MQGMIAAIEFSYIDGSEENIWAYETGSSRWKLNNGELHNLYA